MAGYLLTTDDEYSVLAVLGLKDTRYFRMLCLI